METAPDTAAKVGTLKLTSRFPTRAREAGYGEQTNVEQIKGFFSSQEWADSARNAVRAHPLAAVGVALVAGLLLGRL
jgi:ElaB/YqjD/DUF883 family membrane-anchored ribosome-binding protein